MGKNKYFKCSSLVLLIKCCLIGIISTLAGILLFAVVLKFADLSNQIISYVNMVIKLFSIFIMIMCVKRNNDGNFFIKSLLAGLFYAVLSFTIFSVLNGEFVFNLSVLYDVLFALIGSGIVSVIINILKRKTV